MYNDNFIAFYDQGVFMNSFFSKLDTELFCKHFCGGLTANANTPFHCHDGYEILIFLGGTTSFYVEHQCTSLSKGDIICCPPYTFHRALPKSEQDYERVLINFSEANLLTLNSAHTNLAQCFYNKSVPYRILHLNTDELTTLLQYTQRLENCFTDSFFGNDVLQKALLTEILVMLNRQTPEQSSKNHINTYSPIVTKIFSYIEAHYREEFRIKHLADELHHNADYLTRCFKKTTGCSIQQFVIAKRVNLAQKLLREGNTPLDACYLSGFENYSNFSRTFTKHTGISPKKYQLNT